MFEMQKRTVFRCTMIIIVLSSFVNEFVSKSQIDFRAMLDPIISYNQYTTAFFNLFVLRIIDEFKFFYSFVLVDVKEIFGPCAVFIPLVMGVIFFIVFTLGMITSETLGFCLSFSVFYSFICSCLQLFVFCHYQKLQCFGFFYRWIPFTQAEVLWSVNFDAVSSPVLVMVSLVSVLVHLYSVEYMAKEKNYPYFMFYLTMFTFFMLFLVSSGNYVQLFIGWEGIGLCSYLLIGFWSSRASASQAALKAVVINRFGDAGLLFAIMFCYVFYGTSDFLSLQVITSLSSPVSLSMFGVEIEPTTIIALFLIVAVVGKSAQIGLHTWLPDAMEGPTPVSALIHAATLVTAGVFVVVRSSFIFEHSEIALSFLCVLGGLTAFYGALVAVFQYDIKKIIAYSTCSQLGYMVYACGISNYELAMFHMFNHAYFKALLFLCAGSIIHSLHNEQDIRKMGGLCFFLPFTCLSMFIGFLSLAGFPFFSGFYSKDAIVETSFFSVGSAAVFGHYFILISVFLTSFYCARLFYFIAYPRQSFNVRRVWLELILPDDNTTQLKVNQGSKAYFDYFIKKLFFFMEILRRFFVGLKQQHTRQNSFFFNSVTEPGFFMCFPIFVLSFMSIFSGYFFSDIMIGLGTDFWSASIYHSTFGHVDYRFNSEYSFFYVKLIPTLFSFFGALSAVFLCHYYPSFLFVSSCISSKKSIFRFLFVFFNRKFYFDFFYNYFIVIPLFRFFYNVILHCVDRGFLEYFAGPSFIFHSLKRVYIKYIMYIQTGSLHTYGAVSIFGIFFIFCLGYYWTPTTVRYFIDFSYVATFLFAVTYFGYRCFKVLFRFLLIVVSFFYNKFFFKMTKFFKSKKFRHFKKKYGTRFTVYIAIPLVRYRLRKQNNGRFTLERLAVSDDEKETAGPRDFNKIIFKKKT